MAGSTSASEKAAEQARRDEEERQARIRQGTESIADTFSQFDDDFYAGRKDAYVKFARPQLDEQVSDAKEQLIFALARNGTLDGSVRIDRMADIDKRYSEGLQDIESRGLDFATRARDDVENTRADIVSQLQVTGDAAGASNAALNRAVALSAPEPYSPIEQLFTDATSAFAQQAALERAHSAGYGAKPRFNTGLFGTPDGAVKTRTG